MIITIIITIIISIISITVSADGHGHARVGVVAAPRLRAKTIPGGHLAVFLWEPFPIPGEPFLR